MCLQEFLGRLDGRLTVDRRTGIIMDQRRAGVEIDDEFRLPLAETVKQAKTCLMVILKQAFARHESAFKQISQWFCRHLYYGVLTTKLYVPSMPSPVACIAISRLGSKMPSVSLLATP